MERLYLIAVIASVAGLFIYMTITTVYGYRDMRNGKSGEIIGVLRKIGNTAENGCRKLACGVIKKDTENFVLWGAVMLFSGGAIVYAITDSFIGAAVFSVLITYIGICTLKDRVEKRMNNYGLQLKDWLLSLVNSLKAGMSLEEAVKNSRYDMEKLYGSSRNKVFLRSIQEAITYLNCGKPITEALQVLGSKIESEDIKTFIGAVRIVREKGGNMAEVMASVSQMISDKILIAREIDAMLYAKRMEGKIIIIVPLLLVLLISVASPEYMQSLFGTFAGAVICAISSVMIGTGYFLSRKMTDIRIL